MKQRIENFWLRFGLLLLAVLEISSKHFHGRPQHNNHKKLRLSNNRTHSYRNKHHRFKHKNGKRHNRKSRLKLVKRKRKFGRKLTSPEASTPHPDECVLSMSLFPMFYLQVTRHACFRVIFDSNCIRRRDIEFCTDFGNTKDASWKDFPNKVKFTLWDNFYVLTFNHPEEIDKHDLMRTKMFKSVLVQNVSGIANEINLMKKNEVYLDPQKEGTFNYYTLQKIDSHAGFVQCSIKKTWEESWKLLEKLRKKKMGIISMSPEEEKNLNHDLKRAEEAKLKEDLKNMKNENQTPVEDQNPTEQKPDQNDDTTKMTGNSDNKEGEIKTTEANDVIEKILNEEDDPEKNDFKGMIIEGRNRYITDVHIECEIA